MEWWQRDGKESGETDGKLESRRSKQRTALIETTRTRCSGSRAHTRVAAARARATAQASTHVRVRAIDPIPGVDPSERAAASPSFALSSQGGGYTHSCPFGESGNERKAHTGEYGRS